LPRAPEPETADEPEPGEHPDPPSDRIEASDGATEPEPEHQHGAELDAWFSQSPGPTEDAPDSPAWPAPRTAAGIAQQRNGLFARLFGKRAGAITAVARAPEPPQPPEPSSPHEEVVAVTPTPETEAEATEPPVAPSEPEVAPMIADEPEAAPELAPDMTEPEAHDEVPAPAGAPVESLDPERAEAVLTAVLDDLGAARHRPYSRG
jgi:hypothetical protein